MQGTRDAELEARPWASDCALGLRVEYSNGYNMGDEAVVEWHQMRVDQQAQPPLSPFLDEASAQAFKDCRLQSQQET